MSSCEIEAPSMCYPTLPYPCSSYDKWPWACILPSQPQWSKLPKKTWKVKTRKSFDKRTCTYSCVVHHHHKDHNIRTRWEHNAKENTQLKATREGWILHESQSQQNHTSWKHSTDLNPRVWILHESQWCSKTKSHELTLSASIRECGFYTNPSVHETKANV